MYDIYGSCRDSQLGYLVRNEFVCSRCQQSSGSSGGLNAHPGCVTNWVGSVRMPGKSTSYWNRLGLPECGSDGCLDSGVIGPGFKSSCRLVSLESRGRRWRRRQVSRYRVGLPAISTLPMSKLRTDQCGPRETRSRDCITEFPHNIEASSLRRRLI